MKFIIFTILASCFYISLQSNMNYKSLDYIFQATNHQGKVNQFINLTKDAQICSSANETLSVGLDAISISGIYLEMGVFSGRTINYIAHKKPNEIIHGFDSFEGLPEHWERGDTLMFSKGFFALNQLPPVAQNVILYTGWFENSLPIFKSNFLHDQPIAFIHIDCDLYSSTKTTFDLIGNNIVNGTILVFDELYGYPGFENHELLAFYEFIKQKNWGFKILAYNHNHEQTVIKIIQQH